jgi:pantoate--beta-alanine ligase
MEVFRDAAAMREWSLAQRAAGKSVGFVPTMGALHAGHTSLMAASSKDNDVSVASIFVNPTQFAPNEDFDAYPRTWETDTAMAAEHGVQAIYAPTASGMYAEDYSTFVTVEGVSEGLCSLTRPHFFRGVATVCTKLFNAVLPHRAYFGQKDAQQCAVIKRLVRDLDLQIEIVEMPIVREADGLAMSSRNAYLSEEERIRALCLSRALFEAEEKLRQGERNSVIVEEEIRSHLSDVAIDYVAVVDAASMQPVAAVTGPVTVAVAAFVGKTRLIDNIKFMP